MPWGRRLAEAGEAAVGVRGCGDSPVAPFALEPMGSEWLVFL